MKKLLSVVIVTYHNEDIIEACLKSVTMQLPDNGEVIIVDNGDSVRTKEIVSRFKDAIYINAGGNVGFSKGCNLGVSKSEGELLLFLNPDTRILPGSLRILLETLREYPNFGIISPQLIEESGDVQPSVRRLPTVSGVFAEYFLGQENRYEGYYPEGSEVTEVESVVGAAILIKSDVFLKIGRWDERYFMYYEDFELCRRVKKLGLKIYYVPKARFFHKVGGSISKNKSKFINDSFWIYHGYIEGLAIKLLLYIRPDNMFRIIHKVSFLKR